MDPTEGEEDGRTVEEVIRLPEVSLDEEEEGAVVGGGKEFIADGEKVGERRAAREKGVLGGVNERQNKRDEGPGEILTNNAVDGGGDGDGPELVRRGGWEGLGNEGDVG